MKINQRKAGVILSYTLTGTNVVVGFLFIPILIHFLGQDEYGLYQLMGSILVYLSLFDFGLSNTVTRYYSKYIALRDEKGKENLLALACVIYSILTLILVIAGIILYSYLDEIFVNSLSESEVTTAKKMFIVILITVAITVSTTVFNSIINANERFIFLRVLSIVQTIVRPIIILFVFTFEASALNIVLVQAFINIFMVICKIYYSLKKIKVRIHLHYWDIPLLKEMFRYSFFIFITMVMDQIFWRSDQVILGIVIGTASVAVYSIASQIVMYYMTLSTEMSAVFLPKITKRVMEDASHNELTNIFIKIGRLQFILLGMVLTGFILFGKEFIFIWVGENFSDAYYITLIIMIPFTLDLIQNIGLTILQAKNMYSFRAIVFFLMALLNISISIPLAIYFGGIGAAIATGVSYLIGSGLIMNAYYYKKVGLNVINFWREIGKLCIPLMIAFIFGIFIDQINFEFQFFSLIIKLSFYVVTYAVIMWVLGMNRYEKELILVPLRRFVQK